MPPPIRLLVRADDAGSTLSSNHGCLQAATRGIARSVEVMMPCPWVRHAAALFGAHPEIDIGIHLTLTSEWDAVGWRPLTPAASLVDAQGAFLPLLAPRPGDDRPDLQSHSWMLDDIAAELTAQIRLGQQLFPQASHVSTHMMQHLKGFDPAVGDLVADLCQRFGLDDDAFGHGLPRVAGYPAHPREAAARTQAFIQTLQGLTPGTHIFIDHPATAGDELAALGHDGYTDVHADRTSCLAVLTSPAVQAAIDRLGIALISYRDL